MNSKFVHFIKGFLHALSANVIRLLISIILTLVLPKMLGVEEYSYWQLYLFYVTYTAYSSLGFCEGTYLKYGGKKFDKLKGDVMASQFWLLAIYEVGFSIVCGLLFYSFVDEPMKHFILSLALVSSIFDILRYLLQCVLQATNRIEDFARVATSERVLFFVLAIVLLLAGVRDYRALIFSEILARVLSMLYAMWVCKGIVFCKFQFNKQTFDESRELISIGFKLLLAALASQLVIGIVRFMIEQKWGTIVFGKVSLTLSLSNMVITCIGAVSIVLFPVLKNMQEERLESLYETMRMVLTVPVLFVLLFYVPIKLVLGAWLPQYEESFKYLAVLLPICVYETRSCALINTYFKAYRKENQILFINIVTVVLSLVLSFVTVYICDSLDLAVVSIVVLMIFKSAFSEWILKKYININILYDNILEIALTVIFIVCSMKLQGGYAFLGYFISYVSYLLIRRKKIVEQFMKAKQIVVNR